MIDGSFQRPPASGHSEFHRARELAATLLATLDKLAIPFGLPGRYIVPAALLLISVIVLITSLNLGTGIRLTDKSPSYEVDSLLTIVRENNRPARFDIAITPQEEVFGVQGSQWQEAVEALPPYLEPVSSVYSIKSHRGQVRLVFNLNSNDVPSFPDIYSWNTQERIWQFVPSQIDLDKHTITADLPPDAVALFRVKGIAPLLGTLVRANQTLNPSQYSPLNIVLVEGAEGREDGTLSLEQVKAPSGISAGTAIFPIVRISDAKAVNAILMNRSTTHQFIDNVIALAQTSTFDGIMLDLGALDESQAAAFNRFLSELRPEMTEAGRLLAVRVPTPEATDNGWDTGGYDWHSIGKNVDLVAVTPYGDPGEYRTGGQTAKFLAWATGQISRMQLLPVISSLSIDVWGSQLNPITYDYALAPLGEAELDPAGLDPASSPHINQPLKFHLDGIATNLQQNVDTNSYSYDIYTGDGIHHIWIMTGAALRARLDWLLQFHTAGIILENYAGAGNSPSISLALQEFEANQPSTLTSTLQMHWTVEDETGAVIEDTSAELGTPLAWTPSDEGEYVVHGELVADATTDRGAAAVIVGGNNIGIAPSQEAVVAGAPNLSTSAPNTMAIPPDMPPPVVPPRAYGNFELGGQVNHIIDDPDRMHYSGMRWVKFQLAWSEDQDSSVAWELIERGRKDGFKVLLSVPGRDHYPAAIDIPKYLEFLRGVAYYGPDAIEIWNEANIDYEWPRGQIDGATYTKQMLAPAYNAIKEVNPNIMVISGALAPTGAFFSDGGCSKDGYGCDDWLYLQQMAQTGAANYMDCVGVHFNAGATSPSATDGHPADPGYHHYSWYFPSIVQLYGGTFGRPICFTELGYLSGEGFGGVPRRFDWAGKTSVAQQAQWLAEAAQLSQQNGNVRLLIIWNFDFTYWGDDPMAGYAMVRPDGSCPACDALNRVMP